MSFIGTMLMCAIWFIAGRMWRRRPTRGDRVLAHLQDSARWCRDKNRFLTGSNLAPVSKSILTVDGSDYRIAITPHVPGITLVTARCEQEIPA